MLTSTLQYSLNYRFSILLISLLFLILFIPNPFSEASPLPDSVNSLNIKAIKNLNEMEECLNRLFSKSIQTKKDKQFTFEFQFLILEKSGESINKIIELQKNADLSNKVKVLKFRELFSKNAKILDLIKTTNQEIITEIQELKLDDMEDIDAFLASPQWQTPHRLISLARYWTSWNEYYSSFLFLDDDSVNANLLSSAVKGFSLTLTDIKERVMVIKALFGRALCFNGLGKYKKSIRDFDSVIQKARHDDPLYILSLFEMAQVNYQTGDFDAALNQLNDLDKEEDQNRVTQLLSERHSNLRIKVLLEPRIKRILLDLKKEKDKQGEKAKALCRDALTALNKLSHIDMTQIMRLYHLSNEYSLIYKDYTSDELGPIACLGVADALFNEEKYQEAGKRYTHLWNSPHPLPKRRMDDIYLRSGYCYCQTRQWHDAIGCFDILFNKFPNSDSLDKASCLQFLAASNSYEDNPDKTNYAYYINSIKRYLKGCSNAKDKNGARFQLGKYYHDKHETKEATVAFSAIEETSAYYWPAVYYVLKYDMAKLDSLHRCGKGQTNIAKKYYKDISSRLKTFQELLQNKEINLGIKETSACMTILDARLLFNYGPETLRKNALSILMGFENRYSHNHRILLEAKDLRMSCYMKYQMFKKAQEELLLLDLAGTVTPDLWAFLSKWAGAYYKESNILREKEDRLSSPHAITSAVIYGKLSDIASRNKKTYGKYIDSIQLRWAELLISENQTAKARDIYIEYLKRNPNEAEALNNLGKIYEDEGQWQSALDIWRKFSKGLDSGSDQWFEYRFRIINAYAMLGKDKEACEIISMTLVLHPDIKDEKLEDDMQALKSKVCIK